MKQVTIKAPGKIAISGEYAVLYGYPAIVTAIDRYAQAQFEIAPDVSFSILVASKLEAFAPKKHALLKAALDSAKHFGLKIPPGNYTLNTFDFFNHTTKEKLGFGSSAAMLSAFFGLIEYLNHQKLDPQKIFQMALYAHKKFSMGLGSGMDVAASVFGNAQLFCHKKVLKKLSLDFWSDLFFINTGISQDTRDFVRIFKSTYEKQAVFFKDDLKIMAECSSILSKKCGFAEALMAIRKQACAMASIGKLCGIDIVSEPHRKLIDIAKSFRGAAKPSGAGGGDFSIALIPHESRCSFLAEIERLGFQTYALKISDGVHLA